MDENGRSESENGEEVERAMPEFIYVETEQDYRKESFQDFRGQYGQTFQHMAGKRYPVVLRVICFVLAVMVFLACLIALPFMIFFLLVNTVSLFRAEPLWTRTKLFWEQLKKIFVAGLGLLTAAFSPAFGFSIIMVYLLIKGGNLDDDWIARILQQRMTRK